MALISEIRKRSWILIVLLALALGGFIVMDMVSAGTRASGNDMSIGSVNGDKLEWQDFQRAERILYPNATDDVYGQRTYIWNYMVEEKLLADEAEALGFNVGDEELEELQYGTRLSPVIQRNFRDPNTGQINRQGLEQIKANLGTGKLQPQLEEFWGFQKGEIIKERLQSKLTGLIKKSIYTPTWMAQQLQQEQGSSVDFLYVLVPADKVDEAEVTLTDDDYKNWMKENEGLIQRKEEFRTVDFVVFNVVATPEDTAVVRTRIEDRIAAFRTAENDSAFIENNYGQMEATYFTKEDLSTVIADTAFDLPVGSIYGPYIDGNEFRAFKVIDKKALPDSVKSRHILIQGKTAEELTAASSRIDSLQQLIDNGTASFDTLAKQFSQDGSASQGGDLGWSHNGRMVQPFNDVLFYTGEPGKTYKTITQFGVHLVEITGRKFINNTQGIKLAYLVEPIIPSEQTQDAAYDDALEFSGQNRTIEEMRAAVEKNPALSIETASGLTANGYQFSNLGGGNTSRDIIRWAFEKTTNRGDVAPTVFIYDEPTLFYNARYVVPGLRSIIKPGKATLEDVKANLEEQVKAKKRIDVLASKVTGTDLNAVAQQFGVEVDTFQNVNFNMSYLQGIGNEAGLIGKVTSMKEGEIAGPIKGMNGVYMVQVLHRTEASISTDINSYKTQLVASARGGIDSRLMEAIKSTAKIKDNRFKFY
jgi:peptidyl-prolyl cis-trans isomerase D